MHRLATLSMKNRALVALVTVVVAVFGIFSLTSLKRELTPSISFPVIAVISVYPGASPEVVNDDVSAPIETAIQGIAGLDSTTATSSTSSSIVSATFKYGTDLVATEQKVSLAINRIKSTLPAGVDPQVVSGSIDDLPVLQVAVTGNGDVKALASRIRANVVPELTKIDGVRSVALLGAIGQRVTITPDPVALAKAGFTTADITTALERNGVLIPGGTITQDGSTYSVLAGVKLGSVSDVSALPLLPALSSPGKGQPSTIGAVSAVALADDPVTSISLVDGKPALTLSVTKTPDANTVDVSDAVNKALPDLATKLGDGAAFTSVFDQAPYIQQSITSLGEEGGLGLVFAIVVILLFLLSVRSTLVTAISIPTSLLVTFISLKTVGYSLNIITLGALTIAIGRVVDDSIVVIENIKRHLDRGEERAHTVVTAVREVASAITASTVTTVTVFLPLAFVGGTVGELFRPFSLTVTIALLASLLVALTIVPVLAYWFLRTSKRALTQKATPYRADASATPMTPTSATPVFVPKHAIVEPVVNADDERLTVLQRGYRPIIAWTVRHSVVTMLLAALVLVGTGLLFPMMKTNFLGSSGQNTLTVTQAIASGESLDAQQAVGLKASTALKAVPGVSTVQVSIGSAGGIAAAFGGGQSSGISYSITTDANADQETVQTAIRAAFTGIADAKDVQISSGGGGFGGSTDIAVDIATTDQSQLQTANDSLVTALRALPEASQVQSNLSASSPYIAVKVDRTKAAAVGLSEAAVGAMVSRSIQSARVGGIVIDNTTLSIYLAPTNPPTTTAELADLKIPTIVGLVPLSSLADVTQTNGPASITTQRGQRTATITVTPAGDNLAAASAAVQSAIDKASLPSSVTATLGGATASQADAFSQLGIALLIAILIVYVVMVATFRSLRQPVLLLVSVPFAATGAIVLQVVTGVPLGVASLIGVLMLIGIVVTNAIVLVDLVNQYRDSGMSVPEAVMHGSSRRLRPILMTALATILALTPMALGVTGHGGFISQPLAIVVIGGLFSSTVLTLIVLPTLYNLVEGHRERREAARSV